MKKIKLLYFTVAKNCVSTAQHCRHTFSVEQMTFYCRADDIFEKTVKQSRF